MADETKLRPSDNHGAVISPQQVSVETAPAPSSINFNTQVNVWAGVMPPIQEIEALTRVVPDGGNRLMTLIEEEARHRREMERRQADTNARSLELAHRTLEEEGIAAKRVSEDARIKYRSGFALILMIFVGGLYLCIKNNNVGSYIALLTPLAVIIAGIFASGRQTHQNTAERQSESTTPTEQK